ncbi:MAG: hypothetical protein AB1656_24245 [Candidatus Omnitrophota bacterium]
MIFPKEYRHGDYYVVEFEGKCGAIDAPFLDELFSGIASQNAYFMALDFTRISGFHFSLFGPLVKLRNTLISAGGALILAGFPPDARYTLQAIKMGEGFDFRESLASILQEYPSEEEPDRESSED